MADHQPNPVSTDLPRFSWRELLVFKLIKFYPPYLGAGVEVTHIAPDLTSIEVQMKLRFWNRNYVGTHFGGSLYSMCDPFFMIMLLMRLGRDYIVWDKAATIRFLRPGRGTVTARFELPEAEVERVRRLAATEPKVEPVYNVDVVDAQGDVVAKVEKVLYVRRKDRGRGAVGDG
ncbi:MAG: DUF4442 domain-containing protein [Thermoanaerobaculia bacterium]|nr:DUF4442 domain-containing protein [Thermoanaerobaculia bacterium]